MTSCLLCVGGVVFVFLYFISCCVVCVVHLCFGVLCIGFACFHVLNGFCFGCFLCSGFVLLFYIVSYRVSVYYYFCCFGLLCVAMLCSYWFCVVCSVFVVLKSVPFV